MMIFNQTFMVRLNNVEYLTTHDANTFDFRYERVMVRNALFRTRVEKGTNLARFPGQL